jgi:hypothetical protein
MPRDLNLSVLLDERQREDDGDQAPPTSTMM